MYIDGNPAEPKKGEEKDFSEGIRDKTHMLQPPPPTPRDIKTPSPHPITYLLPALPASPPTMMSKLPLPTFDSFPSTILELGLVRSSKSPSMTASFRKLHVVSKLILRKGDVLVLRP